ncbi:error-prone DNA polymerase, partial [Myxococcota bacterium]|nr:error-prone DNA polymerase [Myxococcota bacterium]
PPDAINRISKEFERLDRPENPEESGQSLQQRVQAIGFDITSPRIRALIDLMQRIHGLPRHLGQHSGGIVIAAGRLDQVVPIEPASMNGRSVVQWDKEDCADLGIIKIDLLGLGMLSALENTIPLIRKHEGVEIDLAHLPADDPKTYSMIQRADTIGVFQIESRAQMATLPRLKPKTFYDLVVEIAIIRPGPIVGQMVHPYLNRRAGREPVTYPHPSLEPILKRTLGVPIFQEQLLRIAMTAAGFTGGEAEELRRAMGFKRSTERMKHIEKRLRSGMAQNGFSLDAQDNIVQQITSFALYGFPESHSASFALIAYASSYLKCHHPAAFLCGLLNAWPMGFYSPATLIQDAQRHGVTVLPIDITQSEWDCTLEAETGHRPSVRIGLRFVTGLRQESGYAIEAERAEHLFLDLPDLVQRIPFKRPEIEALAELGALVRLKGSPQDRRAALWQVASIERDRSSLFAGHVEQARPPQALGKLSQLEETLSDYRLAGLTTGPQIMRHLREALDQRGFTPAQMLSSKPNHQWVQTAGHVIVRQRPGSAKGFLFL